MCGSSRRGIKKVGGAVEEQEVDERDRLKVAPEELRVPVDVPRLSSL